MNNTEHAAELLRTRDRDRYLADLLAPQKARPHLFALHAFAAEVARVKDQVSDPTIGEIRLRWWRDAIAAGDGAGHPIATALIETMRTFALPAAALEMLTEARIFDLYDDPMHTLDDLEGYAGETASLMFQFSAMVVCEGRDPMSSEAAGHGGVAETMVTVLRMLATDPRRAAKYVPETMLVEHGADRASFAGRAATPEVLATLAALRAAARRHLGQAVGALATVPAQAAPAFLPLRLTKAYLDRLDRQASRPFTVADIAPWRRQWILWRAARRGIHAK